MEKLTSTNDFYSLYDIITTSHEEPPTIVISAGTCGQASGANDLIRVAKRELLSKKLSEKISLRITGCHGFCEMEPSVLIEPSRIFYPKVTPEDMVKIIGLSHQKVICTPFYIQGEQLKKKRLPKER